MKRVLKIVGIILGTLVLGLLLFIWIKSEPLPDGKQGSEADALAHKMLKALNMEAYQNTRFLEWTFRESTHYKWDKKRGVCTLKWDANEVHLNLGHPDKSKVHNAGQSVSGEERQKMIEKAVAMFNNDSFWLVAPYKVFDEGVERRLVAMEDGSKALLVTYTEKGTTPGDSYLWLLNDNGFPNAYKMWVKIIPIGGLESAWDDWLVAESGAYLPKTHSLGPTTLSMGAVKGYNE